MYYHIEDRGESGVNVDAKVYSVADALKLFHVESVGYKVYDRDNQTYELWRACGQSKLALVLEYIRGSRRRSTAALFMPPVVSSDEASLAEIVEEVVAHQRKVLP